MKRLALLVLLVLVAKTSVASDRTGTHEKISDYLQVLMPGSALLHGYMQDDIDYQGMGQMSQGVVVSTAIVKSMKWQINATRPNGDCCDSFPSAHSVVAFHTAFYMQDRYGIEHAWPYFVASAYMGYARIHSDNHYFRDVAASAAIAYGVNHFFTSRFGSHDEAKIGFYADPGGAIGLNINFSW